MHIHNKLSHTAEYAFIGSLQEILRTSLSVRKVVHLEYDSSVIIKLSKLEVQTVIDAKCEVNSLIYKGAKIETYSFNTYMERT